MGVPSTFIPVVTEAGKAAAIAASNQGLSLTITHASFGTGQYDPTGLETQLFNEVKRTGVSGALRPRPNQFRVVTAWTDHDDESEIGEIGYWAGNVLFAVWSRAEGGPIGYKTQGVDFVLFCELVFEQVPANSINVSINTDISESLSALVVHEAAQDAHTQYLLRADFVDAHALMTASTVAGTANAITLTLPAETVLSDGYKAGQQIVFVASATNTGPVTVNVNGLGSRSIRKSGSISLAAGDIIAGSVYTLFNDGIAWQLSSGVGGGASMARFTFTATSGQTVFSFPHVPDNLILTLNGRVLDRNVDYTATDGEKITLATPATAGDKIIAVAFKSFAVADAYTKAESDSKYMLASQAPILAPPGMVASFAMESPPSGWLRCNGTLVSRASFPALFAAIGIRFGAGDGSTTFRLPDMRGEFARGWDDGRGVDPGRGLGSSQSDDFKAHSHLDPTGQTGTPNQNSLYEVTPPGQRLPNYDYDGAAPTGTTGGTETRPRNIALLYCIKF